jgi:hypothetical protein
MPWKSARLRRRTCGASDNGKDAAVPPADNFQVPAMTTTSQWDQTGFDAFYQALPTRRRREDEKALSAVFNFAADIPMARDALAWGKENGVKYFVDHKDPEGAYIIPGMGVISFSRKELLSGDLPQMMNNLVHETEHLWQGSRGLSECSDGSFFPNWVSASLAEADAAAHGIAALRQANYFLAGIPFEEHVMRPSWKTFSAWFNCSWLDEYTSDQVHEYMSGYNLYKKKDVPADNFDFGDELCDIPCALSRMDGMNLASPQDIFDKLGRGFLGKNYFNPVAAPAFLEKVIQPGFMTDIFDQYLPEQLPYLKKILTHENKLRARL